MLVRQIWAKQPGKFFCISTKSQGGLFRDHWFTRHDFDQLHSFIRDYIDHDVYFCPHGFNVKRRKKEHAVPPYLLWADLDEVDPTRIKPKPTIALESSPGRYVGFWIVDKPVTDTINKQLTYAIGADKGGWDYTQVLRVPNTYNYKYKTHPKVKILWEDGPPHHLEDIVKYLPTNTAGTDVDPGVQGSDLIASDVYKKWEKEIPPWARREIIKGKPRKGNRSDMLWKLEHALLEIGMARDEAFVLIKSSAWNKFAGRKNEDEQLRRELSKVVDQNIGHTQTKLHLNGHDANGHVFEWKSIDQFEFEQVNWIWYPYVARGEVTIIEGDPGIGKSMVTQCIGMHIVEGRKLPSPRWYPKMPPGKVLYFDIENRPGAVTRPRLEDMGITSEGMKRFIQQDRPWTIDDEDVFQEVVDYIRENKPDIVVFDTLNTYIGQADTYKSSESQQAFNNFRIIASEFNCAVIVLRHLTKSSKDSALYRGQGSIAFVGVARIVIAVGYHPKEEGQLLLSVTKNNLAMKPDALSFTLKRLPDTKGRKDRMTIEWGEYVEGITSDQIFMKPNNEERSKGPEGVKEFLKELLEDGPVDKDKIVRAAEKRGIKERALSIAAEDLHVVKRTEGFGSKRRAVWELS